MGEDGIEEKSQKDEIEGSASTIRAAFPRCTATDRRCII